MINDPIVRQAFLALSKPLAKQKQIAQQALDEVAAIRTAPFKSPPFLSPWDYVEKE